VVSKKRLGFHKLFLYLQTHGCGFTLDVFTDNRGVKVVQWIWSCPIDREGKNRLLQILRSIERLNLPGAEESGLTVKLQNGIDQLRECPFQPQHCKGSHYVASGNCLD
jgi:hypothetical protein